MVDIEQINNGKCLRAQITLIPLSVSTEDKLTTPEHDNFNSENVASDDDFEEDQPCDVTMITLPNSNTDRNITNAIQQCALCPHQAEQGWKTLTKHYVRKHQNAEIPTSRLPSKFVPSQLAENPIVSTAANTKHTHEISIKSLCLFCDHTYDLVAAKWLIHFISHTGEYEFECNACQCKLITDLHKPCNSRNNKRLLEHELKENKLFGYTCVKCNFTQLSRDNLIKHIDQQHQILSEKIDDYVLEILLLNFVEPERSDDHNENELIDTKDTSVLVEARRMSVPQFTSIRSPIIISDAEDDATDTEITFNENDGSLDDNIVDLTLSDEE